MSDANHVPLTILPADYNGPDEVRGVNVPDTIATAELFIRQFAVIASALGPEVALSGLATACDTLFRRLMVEEDYRTALQTTVNALPDLYRKQAEADRKRLDGLN
ncbi:MAG: hypothetical protein AB7H90_03380 [Alphaproteobacteria bacterium]